MTRHDPRSGQGTCWWLVLLAAGACAPGGGGVTPVPVAPGVFAAPIRLAAGELLATASGDDGRAYVLMRAPNGKLQLASCAEATPPSGVLEWQGPEDVGIVQPAPAAVRADATGRVVIVAGNVFVERVPGGGFTAPVVIASGAPLAVDLAVSPTGHIAVAWADLQNGYVRMVVPGLGLGPVHTLPLTIPRVSLRPTGEGTAVCAFSEDYHVSNRSWNERWCLDSLGGISSCDPRPGTPVSRPLSSRAWFGGALRIVCTHTFWLSLGGGEPAFEARLYDSPAGGAWAQPRPVVLGSLDGSPVTNLAGNRNGRVLFAGANAAGTRAWIQEVAGGAWSEGRFDNPAVRPPINPIDFVLSVAAGVTNSGSGVVAWTARAGTYPAPVRLFAVDQPLGGAWSQARALSTALGPSHTPETRAEIATVGSSSAVILWSQDGQVLTAAYR